MKKYEESLVCDINSEIAWNALKMMNEWLPRLSTNKGVKYDLNGDFFYEGRKYEVVTKEGIVMNSEIYKVEEENKYIEIHASHSLLKSILTCSVEKVDENTCKLVRTQAYPGLVGFIFTTFFYKREAGETGEYLKVWSAYAIEKMKKESI